MGALYTRGEVVWLLSITHEEAVAHDATPRDSCSNLSADDGGHSSAVVEVSLPTVLRWHDVHAARRAIAGDKMASMVVRLRGEGFSEREIASVLAAPKTTVRRRFDATLREIIERLGGADGLDVAPVAASCLVCAAAPRVRLAPVVKTVKGKLREVVPARTATVCVGCLSPDRGMPLRRVA